MPLPKPAGSVIVTVLAATAVPVGATVVVLSNSVTLTPAPGETEKVTGSLKTNETVLAVGSNVADWSVGVVTSVSSTPGRPCACSLDRQPAAASQSISGAAGLRTT